MVSLEDGEDSLVSKHEELTNKLNLDEETAAKAWESFETIVKSYTLEGDSLHWLGCAIFEACCTQKVPTVGKTGVVGNCVNLTSLLRHCNLSLAHFFDKIKKWADMANLSGEFRQKINNLESNFAVAFNIFKEFQPMFMKVFKTPNDTDLPKLHRSRKQKTLCTPTQIFEFCWLLFITVKGEDPGCGDDLVTSYHVLQACVDLIFKNALLDNRRDLLNPGFEALPSNWNDPEYAPPSEAPCIIHILGAKHKDMITESKYVKEYTWKTSVQNLFQDGILHGTEANFTELLTCANFDANMKSVTRAYEQHLLNKGDFDERILLAEYKRQLILTRNAIRNGSVPVQHTAPQGENDSPKNNSYGEVAQRAPDTPLTGRNYLGPRDQNEETPLSTAAKSVARLQALLNGRTAAISSGLSQMFLSCSIDPSKIIEGIIKELGKKFCAKYGQQVGNSNSTDHSQRSQVDHASKRLGFGITLFYKLLEKILEVENKKLQDISPLLGKSVFYESLFACSLEIVIYSYSSQRKFPWILETLELSEFYFVRVIELIIRSEDQLPRDVIKHLNMVEEMILESLMWRNDSLLWEALKQLTVGIPKFEEIALKNTMVYSSNATNNSDSPVSQSNPQTPTPSAVETFQSPMGHQVKKQLFPIKATSQVLQKLTATPTHLVYTDAAGNKQLLQLINSSTIEPVAPAPPPLEVQPKKNDSLSIIFRKFYNLAGERMEHLCKHLDIEDIQLKCKIWTVFEYSIRKQTDLIKDRHLDQLLMCAVYVICKVLQVFQEEKKLFQLIMHCYRSQPQAKSSIYRDVLLEKNDNEIVRGDLIKFYNNIYVRAMKTFAQKFSKSNQNKDLLLSPIPTVKSLMASPKQQITENVFVKPYESPSTQSAGKTYKYYFNRSASKDLKAINTSICGGKRKLLDFEDDSSIANRKVKTLIEERRVQNME